MRQFSIPDLYILFDLARDDEKVTAQQPALPHYVLLFNRCQVCGQWSGPFSVIQSVVHAPCSLVRPVVCCQVRGPGPGPLSVVRSMVCCQVRSVFHKVVRGQVRGPWSGPWSVVRFVVCFLVRGLLSGPWSLV